MSTTRWHRIALGIVALLAACSDPPPGPARTETRSVEAFHAIEFRGNGEASISVGKPQAVTVTSEESALPDIVTKVEKGVLIVEHVKGAWFRRPALRMQIDVPAVDSIVLTGAAIVSIVNMAGPRLELVSSGAGNIHASGEVNALNARLDGAGNLRLADLHAGDASVSVNGAGSIAVHVTGQLEATVNGVGAITYAGNPRDVVRHVNGVGTISPAGSPAP
jgi:hypothetical protein